MDLKKLLKTTPKFISTLNVNGINSLKDLFMYFPRTYEDRSNIKKLNEILIDDTIQSVRGKIVSKTMIRTRSGKRLAEIIFEDENGNKGFINLLNANFVFTSIKKDSRYVIIGKPQFEKGKIFFWHPELVLTAHDENDATGSEPFKIGRIYPIYPEMMGISSGWFAKKTWENLYQIKECFQEILPDRLIKDYDLMEITQCIKNIHYPDNFEIIKKAKYRIIFERLLKIQLISLINKKNYQNITTESNQPDRNIIKQFIEKLPFELTNAQKKSIKNIIEDIESGKPMMRLLQGDVGSGKTIVATAAAYYIIKKIGGQVALLAPTEVLATQHAISISKLLLPLGININVLTGTTTQKEKEKIKLDLGTGKINLIIGTHAILQEDIEFKNLKLAIIDEQHKFGVMQRAFFKKFESPHILQMTATPIPRSLTLAFFGEFDVSIIDEMPKGRQEIFTKTISQSEFIKMKPWINTKISQGQNIYIVTPLIEDSEKMDELKSATSEFDEINQLYPELKGHIGLLHGKIKPKEKEQIMNDFKSGKIKILVSTTVIEVGIDVPHATVMIIKNAERFGLSQLHQLRGRVGRSDLKSYCFLVTKSKSGDSYKRLRAMEEISDGFKLAQLDLEIRGSGEILGTRQSGEADIPAEILTDIKFLEKIQEAALQLLEKSPDLNKYPELKEKILNENKDTLI